MTPTRPPLDEAALARYVHRTVCSDWASVGVESVTRVTGGLSWETFIIELRDLCGSGSRRVVVKRAPVAGPLAPYDVQREAALPRALRESDVPVAGILAVETDPTVLGSPFLVMQFVEGEIPALRTIEKWEKWSDVEARRRVATEVVGMLTRLQAFDWQAAGLDAVLGRGDAATRVGEVIERLMGRIDRYVTEQWCASPVCREAARWLVDNVPSLEEHDLVIVHGDFRIGNLVWQSERIAAVLDWERATLGDPMQDLGFFCMPMARQRSPELMGMLLSLDDLVQSYERIGGRAICLERLHYYVVFWQFVELAQVTRAIAYLLDEAPRGEALSLTSYPLLSSGAVELLESIEDHEAGRFDLVSADGLVR